MRRFFLFLFCLSFIFNIFSQSFEVRKFELDVKNEDALTHHRFDKTGQICALVIARTSIKNISFSVIESGIIDKINNIESNEIWLYLSPIQNTIVIEKTGFTTTSYKTPLLESGKTYIMEILEESEKETIQKGTIYIISNPPKATIQLNKIPNGQTPKFITGLKPGTYEVKLTSDGYRTYTRDVVVSSDHTTEFIANLISEDSIASQALRLNTSTPKRDNKQKNINFNKLMLGVNAGVAKPNNYTANFYNGSNSNANAINVVLMNTYQPSYHEAIVEAIGYDFDSLTDESLPLDMVYKLSYDIGFYAGWCFNKTNRVFLEFNYNRLQTSDIFLIYKDNPYAAFPEYTECKIRGVEDRFYINLGYCHDFYSGPYTRWYLEGGIQLTSNIVRKNDIQIPNKNNTSEPLEYDIMYHGYRSMNDQNYQNYYNIRQGGIGFGGFAGAGFRLVFSDMVSLDPGFQFIYSNVRYNVDSQWNQYDEYKFWFQAFIRLTFTNLWSNN